MENDHYGGGFVMVWGDVAIDSLTNLQVLDKGIMTPQRHKCPGSNCETVFRCSW